MVSKNCHTYLKRLLNTLLFWATCQCEAGFSSFPSMKTIYLNRLITDIYIQIQLFSLSKALDLQKPKNDTILLPLFVLKNVS